MAITITQLFQPQQLASPAPAVIYSLTAGVLKNGRVRLTNTTASAVSVSLYCAPSAATSAPGNCFLSSVSIAVNGYIDVDLPTMQGGDTLRGVATAGSAVTVHELGGVIHT